MERHFTRTSVLDVTYRILLELTMVETAPRLDVMPAQIQPHPHRLNIPIPMQAGSDHDMPHFEKSNVLVMCVWLDVVFH